MRCRPRRIAALDKKDSQTAYVLKSPTVIAKVIMWHSSLSLVLLLYISISVVSSACTMRVYYGDPECRSTVEPTYGDNDRVLLDNRAYLDPDWTKSPTIFAIGSNCDRGFFVCYVTDSDRVISNAVDVTGLTQVSVKVTLDLSFCNDCTGIKLCRYFSNLPLSNTERTSLSGGNCSTYPTDVPQDVSVPAGVNWLYLAFSATLPQPQFDPFYCATLQRVIVKYNVCPCKQEGLVVYPEAIIESGASKLYTARCVDNAGNTTSLDGTTAGCKDVAPGGAKCACNVGYEESSDGTSCTPCSVNEYRDDSAARCLPCPDNSFSITTGSTSCLCRTGYFRTQLESNSDSCTRSPPVVRDLIASETYTTRIALKWRCPVIPGRSDLYYRICHKVALTTDRSCSDYNPLSTTCNTSYSITGLQSFTPYEVCVSSHNGVSDQDPDSLEDRTICLSGIFTKAGVPERPILKHLCTVVIWKPPTVPNGEIQGYELKFINSAGLEEVFNYTATDNFQLTSDIQREENVLVQIRVRNSANFSPWVPSPPQPIGCDNIATCPPVPACPYTIKEDPVTTTEEPIIEPTTSVGCCGYPACTPDVVNQFGGVDVESVNANDIRLGNNALFCQTSFPQCCKGQGARGEFLYPDCSLVGKKSDGQVLFRNRGQRFIRLNSHDDGRSIPSGAYGCVIPNNVGVDCCKTVNLYSN